MGSFLSGKEVACGIPQGLALGLHSFLLFMLYKLELGSTWRGKKPYLENQVFFLQTQLLFSSMSTLSPLPFSPLLAIITHLFAFIFL